MKIVQADCDADSPNMTKSLKNATLKLSENPVDSMDKFLQQLEMGVVKYIGTKQVDDLIQVLDKNRVDKMFASSQYYDTMMTTIQLTLMEEKGISKTQLSTKLSIAIDKLIKNELEVFNPNHEVLSAAMATLSDNESSRRITDKLNRAKNAEHAEKLLEFAVQYFTSSSEYYHDFKSSLLVTKWQKKLDKYRINVKIQEKNLAVVVFALLNSSDVTLESVTDFIIDFQLERKTLFLKFLRHHLLGEEIHNTQGTSTVVALQSEEQGGRVSKMALQAAWSLIRTRIGKIIDDISEYCLKDIAQLISQAYHATDKRDYDKLEFLIDQLARLSEKGFKLSMGSQIVENTLESQIESLQKSIKVFKNFRFVSYITQAISYNVIYI